MCEMIELGLSRNRVFEPYSAVIFSGKYKEKFNEEDAKKAFRLLLEKEPVLSCAITLENNGKVFLVSEKVSQKIDFSQNKAKDIIDSYNKQGLDVTECLFEFYITADNYFVIVSHTAISDGKSLLRLAKCFVSFYEKKDISIEANSINAFSSFSDLPVDIASPLTDKLAANLDEKWNKKPLSYDINDYKKLQYECAAKGVTTEEVSRVISCDEMRRIRKYCQEENMDVSSVIGFAFYKTLLGKIQGDKKFERLVAASDRRFFLNDSQKYSVGAFDGDVEIFLSKKEQGENLGEQMKDFHLSMYKGATSVFKSFYDDVLLMKIEPSYCHSAYMYAFGFNKNKASKKLAENYSCMCQKMCRYSSYNLDQIYWQELQSFSDVSVRESVRTAFAASVNFVANKGEGRVIFRFKSNKLTPEQAKDILEKALLMLRDFEK